MPISQRDRNSYGDSHSMLPDKNQLYEAIDKNLEQIHRYLDQHQCLLASILDETYDSQRQEMISKYCPRIIREEKFKKAIQEAIEVLEQSKKSFKSKRLEDLRKRLTKVLMGGLS